MSAVFNTFVSFYCKIFTGLFDHEKECVHLNDGVPKETFCPRGYLEFKNPLLSFDPEKEECSETYDKTNMRILQECKYRNDSEKCLIDMSTDIRSHPECFQVYELQILHTCEGEQTVREPCIWSITKQNL